MGRRAVMSYDVAFFWVSSSSLAFLFLVCFSFLLIPIPVHCIHVHGRVSGCLLCLFDPADLSWGMQFGNGHLRLGIVSCLCWAAFRCGGLVILI
ncbi:hypothetical protein B0I37DRAFT_172713 [Chaetomium sp. MPI-CAGE-AT-0009]|nr:hypothetical protein B0I37DRAFT_172713 [Chaetomium sp. MPI-CAGE-AT-0009]